MLKSYGSLALVCLFWGLYRVVMISTVSRGNRENDIGVSLSLDHDCIKLTFK